MKSVKQVLQEKGSTVWSINPDATVFSALEFMAEKNIGALIVIDENEVIGIMSERDYARKVILAGKSSKDVPVREIMTTMVLFVNPENSMGDCMALMTDKHIRHLPVIDKGQLAGVISIGDVVKSIITEQEYLIDHLTNYITGR
jgi:CBS domain-containing protein